MAAALDAIVRMHTPLFRQYGVDATLDGASVVVILDREVALIGECGQVTAVVAMASIRSSDSPRKGAVLVVGTEHYTLGRVHANDGAVIDFILDPVVA